ncbi:flagellar basal body-associated FliL family protein [Polycladidibacter stylochi]|uniref:flagellar basal body-associated FliL family protein n=1 Tax=Polycladidibacter stylochi TaxID=1807766 RepID=UPI00082B1286|nr:flagellar basal body-associated FliL family protein [Pseudovibrio stylochi]
MSDVTQEDEGLKKGKRNGFVRYGAIALGLLCLLAGTAYSLGWFSSDNQLIEGTEERKPVVFYDLPEMLVNLSTEGQLTYLKVRIALEMESREMIDQVEPFLPRIMDAFQIYLRELRPADLEGSAGLFRLKEQLLRRINVAVYPARVDGILFKEILIQ